jgi:hypothetical protein
LAKIEKWLFISYKKKVYFVKEGRGEFIRDWMNSFFGKYETNLGFQDQKQLKKEQKWRRVVENGQKG